IIIHGNGEQWRPLLSVNDVVSAFISVMEAPLDVVAGEIYNVGGKDSNIQIRELASIIASQLPNVNIEFAPKLTDQRSYHLNFDKILNRLNYHPNTSHLEGVLSIIHAIQSKKIDPGDPTFYTVDWYRKRVFPKINQNMRSDRNHD
ncbi:MAG: NAD-dependent epimerase/dehydratase family protein, partial [Fidelibacterota bacterium]